MPDDEWTEEQVYFEGPCTCEHEEGEHEWGHCGADDESGNECLCEAGWTE